MKKKKYTGHLGPFDYWHKNPPKPFNPNYDPKAEGRSSRVVKSMEEDGFYETHTREECKEEYRKRYDQLKKEGK